VNKVQQAIEKLKSGGIVIIQDSKSRENEGDLVCSAVNCSAENINFITKYARGVVCLALPYEKVQSLSLEMQPRRGDNLFQTPFTVSIDAAKGITTGVSAKERALTIKTAAAENCKIEDLATPGHVFPLRAHPDGLVARSGHTEASIAIMELAGLSASAVVCEIMNEDGSMSRTDDLEKFALKHNIPVVTVEEIKHVMLQRVS
jgi:3,4-dihydroxy 2-butanone 4-phosphate synthase/GTP cyclohydrolase II